MLIHDIAPYIIDVDTKMQIALEKINANHHKIIFVTTSKGEVIGSISDGDFRRWLLRGNHLTPGTTVSAIYNLDVKYIYDDKLDTVDKLDFSDGKTVLPVVDKQRRIICLLTEMGSGFFICDHEIKSSSPTFIIAEIGNNHQGNIQIAKKLILHARDAGVHCVKFQMRSMDALYGASSNSKKNTEDLGSQYTLDLLKKFQLSDEELFEVFDFSSANGLIPLCTPWDKNSLRKLEAYGMPAYKVASADFTNFELLKDIANTHKPMLCSTGMSTQSEIISTVEFLKQQNANFLLLHCNSTYPTPYKDVQLNYLKRLEELSGRCVGYSGHERGVHIPVAACALGAKVIEKHITLDREQEGTDHKVSLLPSEFKEMCSFISDIETALGSKSYERNLSQGELINRQTLAKSIYVNRQILINEIIERDDLVIRGPGKGLQPNMVDKVVGIRANRTIEVDTELFESDLTQAVVKQECYQISRPFGIPVRYHDYAELISGITLDFVEFHLSYGDLNLDPSMFLKKNADLSYAVHCPELFENDHLLDLTSLDENYRLQSIQNLNKTIEITLKLKNFFPMTKFPTLIVNVGGWSNEGFLSEDDKMYRYNLLKKSLRKIHLDGVNLAIQTMPPFPWHFGGQSHHNLFVNPSEIVNFFQEVDNVSLCLDTSHSKMACNYYGWDFAEFIRKIAPYTNYIHLADASGMDGEGVTFGRGDIDFHEIWPLLSKVIPDAPFIPEVWQGHINSGAGFWKALEFIQQIDGE
jgi:N-acetylneuraminate synthase